MTMPTTLPTEFDRYATEDDMRQRIRRHFSSWTRLALPSGQAPAAHHLLLMGALRDVCMGHTDRLMVLMPPGSAKSTYASVLFPPWWFLNHPTSNVIAASHTAALAGAFGGRVRGAIGEHGALLGYGLSDPRARDDFRLSCGGTYFAVGVRGAVTGRRADLILIDDPVASHETADSATEREQLWEWYRSDLLTRLKPGGRVVLIMTRWHQDDIGGRLLQGADTWRCVKLPALAGANDPLGRAPGTPLWPQWEDGMALERRRTTLGERSWAALYQQEPRPPDGNTFKPGMIGTVDVATPERCVRAWDLAATAAGGDYTVGLKLGREAGGRFVVLDVVRFQGSPLEVERRIAAVARADGAATTISLPQDPGQAGKFQAQYLIRGLAGFRVSASVESGDKDHRAAPVSCQADAGNLAVLRAGWNRDFLDELAEAPGGRHDDQIDALSRAFTALINTPTRNHRRPTDIMGR